jgi:CHASE3 domain sensor protein
VKKDNDPILDFLSFLVVVTVLFIMYFAFYIGTLKYRDSKQELPEAPVDIQTKLSRYLVTNS